MDSKQHRILIVTPYLARAGSEVMLLNVADSFIKRGHEVHVLVIDGRIELTPNPKIHLHELSYPKLLNQKLIKETLLRNKIKKLDKQFNFDLILSAFATSRTFLTGRLADKTFYWYQFNHQQQCIRYEAAGNHKKSKKLFGK